VLYTGTGAKVSPTSSRVQSDELFEYIVKRLAMY
jgi:hypothetical protein